MVRKNYMVTPRQDDELKKEAKRLQVSVSEVLRKAIDNYFARQKTC